MKFSCTVEIYLIFQPTKKLIPDYALIHNSLYLGYNPVNTCEAAINGLEVSVNSRQVCLKSLEAQSTYKYAEMDRSEQHKPQPFSNGDLIV
jgi:hypothetical protein